MRLISSKPALTLICAFLLGSSLLSVGNISEIIDCSEGASLQNHSRVFAVTENSFFAPSGISEYEPDLIRKIIGDRASCMNYAVGYADGYCAGIGGCSSNAEKWAIVSSAYYRCLNNIQ